MHWTYLVELSAFSVYKVQLPLRTKTPVKDILIFNKGSTLNAHADISGLFSLILLA